MRTDLTIRGMRVSATIDNGTTLTFDITAETAHNEGPLVKLLSSVTPTALVTPPLTTEEADYMVRLVAEALIDADLLETIPEYTDEDRIADEGDRLYHQARDEETL